MKSKWISRALIVGVAIAAAGAFSAGAQADTLVLAAPGTPEGFDGDALRPFAQHVVVQTYEGLTRNPVTTGADGRPILDPTKVEGHLAESWEFSNGGKTLTFKLREGVRSPYGNELTADDVEWSWAKSFAQKRTGNFIARVSNVIGVKAISKYEVEFTLDAPSAIVLNALTLYVPGIYDSTETKKHATADDPWALKWMATHTAGFGAYHLESIKAGEQAIFVANENYFRKKPQFDRVVWRAVPSGASRITLLKSGQVQWIDRATIQQVIDMQKDDRVKVEGAVGRAIASVRMNLKFKPFDDVRVRQALNYAIDKKKIQQAVFLGTGTIAKSIVPPIIDGYDPSFYTYDYNPEKAKALLAEAGVGDGFEVELSYSSIWPWQEAMAIQVADQLKAIGVKATPKRITDSDHRSRVAPAVQDIPFFTFEDGPIVLDPVYTLFLMARSTGVSNRAGYKNEKLDSLIDEAKSTLDRDKRLELMREAQKIWVEDAPWLLTVYPDTFEAMSPNIVGWVHYPDEHERWRDLRTK